MVSFYSWDSLWIYTNTRRMAVVDYKTANELILRMGRGLTVTGAEAKALFDGATATMQGANLIENEYAPLVPQYANFFFHNRISWVSCFFWCCIQFYNIN